MCGVCVGGGGRVFNYTYIYSQTGRPCEVAELVGVLVAETIHPACMERTPIEATPLSATPAELGLGLGLGSGLGSHSSLHAPLLLATLLSHNISLPRVH